MNLRAGALPRAGLAGRSEWEGLRAVVVAVALLILLGSVIMVLWLPRTS